MGTKEIKFYDKIKNWDFSSIKYTSEYLTNWDMYDILKQSANEKSKVLDLGTGGGEKVLKYFPNVLEVVATDLSSEMIKTAKANLAKAGKQNIVFKQMDNLKMTTQDNYFDVVVARHTVIDANGIYKTLKKGGKLILRGVDKLDCWELKRDFNRGQDYLEEKPISVIDYEDILNAGFKNVELVPIHAREYYKTKEDLLALLLKTPIINNFEVPTEESFSEKDLKILDSYISRHTTPKGIILIRRYYGITAEK